MSRGRSSSSRAAAILAGLTAALLLILAWYRPGLERLWGDEATYVAMTASLAEDYDLVFDQGDRAREEWRRIDGVEGIILHRVAKSGLIPGVPAVLEDYEFAYSKPIVYALWAAPFYRIAGENGLIAMNVLVLAVALLLALRLFRQRARPGKAILILVTFVFAGALLPYLLWRMTEILEVSLVLGGLALVLFQSFKASRRAWDHPLLPLAGMVLLAFAAVLRYPNAAFLAAPVLASLFERRWLRAGILASAAIVAIAAVLGLSAKLTGTALPYKAIRSTFGGEAGFPVGDGAVASFARFETHWARNEIKLKPRFSAAKTAYAACYFLIGRHSGVFLYLPLAPMLFLLALRQRDATGVALLAAVVAVAAFYLVWMPENYFGGGTAVGNRYLLAAYPALLFAPRDLPTFRHFLFTWTVALVGLGSAAYSVVATAAFDRGSQSHTSYGLSRWLPYESTSPDLDGRRDRYWSGDFLRFTDPFAAVADTSFDLSSDDDIELLIASRSAAPPVVMLAADAPNLVLEYQDYWQRRSHRLVADEQGRVRAVIPLDLARPWRHHPMWWSRDAYAVRLVRLGVRTAEGRRVAATLRYLGDGAIVNANPARRLLAVTLPSEVVAGSRSTIPVRVQNLSAFAWSSSAPVPVHLGYRLSLADGNEVAGARRTRLSAEVAPGGEARADVEVVWPRQPGRYQFRLDLVMEGLVWFEERVGEPLVAAEVEVVVAQAHGR